MENQEKFNPVEQKMLESINYWEPEESAIRCAKVAEDVAIEFARWYQTNGWMEYAKEFTEQYPTPDRDTFMYNKFINQVYKKQ